jgi:1-phosphatidylinositol-4-phosphate 5-kinase
VKFISSVTKTREAADREKAAETAHATSDPLLTGINVTSAERDSTERVLQKAEGQAERSRRRGAVEDDVPHREMRMVRSPSAERGELGTTLPVVEEAAESASTGGRSGRSTETHLQPAPMLREEDRQRGAGSRDQSHGHPPPTPPKDSGTAPSEERPPTPAKDARYANRHSGPPTPPKEERGRGKDKELPHLPPMETVVRVN